MPAASTRSRPARFATRAAASSPTESRARRPSAQRRRHPQPRRRRGPGAGTAGARGRRRGRALRPAGTARARATTCAEPAACGERGHEQRGQRAGEVPPPALLVGEQRRAQRPAVAAGRARPAARRAASATGAAPSRAAQPAHHPGPGAAQPPQEPGRSRSSRAASRTRGDSGGEAPEEVLHAASVADRDDGTRPTTAGTAELSTGRGRRPQARAAGRRTRRQPG